MCNQETHPTVPNIPWILFRLISPDTILLFLDFLAKFSSHLARVEIRGGGVYYRDLGLGFWGRLVLQGLRTRVLGGLVLQRSLDSPNFAGNGWVAGHRLWRHLKLRVRPWQKIRKAQRATKLTHQIYFILTLTLYEMSKGVWPVGTKSQCFMFDGSPLEYSVCYLFMCIFLSDVWFTCLLLHFTPVEEGLSSSWLHVLENKST